MSNFIDTGSKLFNTVLDPIGSLISGGAKMLTGGSPQAPDMTPPATLINPEAMPSITSDASRQARRQSYAQQLARKGRASTILSNTDSLGPGG